MSTNAERQRRLQKKRKDAVAQLPGLLARVAELEAENGRLKAALEDYERLHEQLGFPRPPVTNALPKDQESLVTDREVIENTW